MCGRSPAPCYLGKGAGGQQRTAWSRAGGLEDGKDWSGTGGLEGGKDWSGKGFCGKVGKMGIANCLNKALS